ncbi:MAG: DUF72 domain-containing protein [Armatimonadota bacterium]
MGDIRLGTSGYSFQSWKGTAYPSGMKDSGMFDHYIDQFRLNTVELNYTYYRLPSTKGIASMAKRSPDNFDFTVKLFGGITHEPWKNFPPTHVDTGLCDRFIEGIKPLTDSGKLGCVLAQFPASLLRSPEAWGYLLSLPDALNRLPMVYEFRNKGWVSEETVQLLKYAGVGLCTVDEPQIGALMPVYPKVTSDIAYLRFHGRNKNWFKDPSQRYDYLYSEKELTEFIPTIESMASQSRTLYVAFNNCHAGAAVRNVKMLQALLGLDLPPLQGDLF